MHFRVQQLVAYCRSIESCFSANSGLAMVYGCVMLVVGVLATVTTGMDGLQTTVGELKALKDVNGVRQCATSPPNTIVTARSTIDCMRVCLSDGSSCAHGANYRADNKTCEMYSALPASFEQVTNCVFYQVLIWCQLCEISPKTTKTG